MPVNSSNNSSKSTRSDKAEAGIPSIMHIFSNVSDGEHKNRDTDKDRGNKPFELNHINSNELLMYDTKKELRSIVLNQQNNTSEISDYANDLTLNMYNNNSNNFVMLKSFNRSKQLLNGNETGNTNKNSNNSRNNNSNNFNSIDANSIDSINLNTDLNMHDDGDLSETDASTMATTNFIGIKLKKS